MGIFSEELAILDKNTVDYMIDEMQNNIDELKNRQDNLKRLNQKLLADNRLEDLVRSVDDEKFQHKLLAEYRLL